MKTDKQRDNEFYDEMINTFSTVRRLEMLEGRCRALETKVEQLQKGDVTKEQIRRILREQELAKTVTYQRKDTGEVREIPIR